MGIAVGELVALTVACDMGRDCVGMEGDAGTQSMVSAEGTKELAGELVGELVA